VFYGRSEKVNALVGAVRGGFVDELIADEKAAARMPGFLWR
jgi:DNA-binding transcriptional regulator LsrR (DeoR family)